MEEGRRQGGNSWEEEVAGRRIAQSAGGSRWKKVEGGCRAQVEEGRNSEQVGAGLFIYLFIYLTLVNSYIFQKNNNKKNII